MYVEFQSIYLKRFRSFQDEAVLHFNSAGTGLYFLKGKNAAQTALGSNGSGKSTILDGISWCLYGKTVQGLKNTDITPWTGKGQTVVEVTISVDKKQYHIRRTVGPNLLTIDGKEAGQEYIDKLIGIPIEIMPYTIIMGQRRPLFFDLTASEKLKLFSECLNLERWEERSAHASELTKNLETEIGSIEIRIEGYKSASVQAEAAVKSWKEKSTEWEAERSDALKNKNKDRTQLEIALNALQLKHGEADLALDRAETELRAIEPTLVKLQSENYALGKKSTQADSLYQRLYLERESLLKELEVVDAGTCPTCKQPLKTHKKALQSEIDKEATELAKQIKTAVAASKQAQADYDANQTAVDAQIEAKFKFQPEADSARDELTRLDKQIAEYQAQIKALDERIKEYENQDNPFSEHAQAARTQQAQIKLQIAEAEKKLETKKEYCERTRYWIKGFKDIKLYTLTEILQELQITTNAMLEEFGLVGWSIEYDIERETKAKTIARGLNITVLSPSNKDAVKWESWSGGEAQRLRIIGSIALGSVLLNHLGVSTNLMAFDEPTESLSKEGVIDLVELLANHARDTKKTVWLVDHHTVESSHFVDVITVIKDKQGSRLL